MSINAAQLLVRINADTASAQQGIGGLAGLLGSGGVLALGAAAAAAAVAGVGVASVKMAGDFQAGMTSLVTGAGESQANLKMVSDGILKMAVDTGTSTKQLTDGMYMIESAGYHGKAGLDILKAAAEGAKVGNADLGTVADATTTILKDFGNTGITASGAVNTLIATVASGKTHMADLSGALAQVLPTASAAHIGLQDVMGAMATMTGEGVPAANAATYLRQTMLALDAPSTAAQKALRSVGLSSAEVSAEMQKSLPGALKMITDAVGKKFPEGSAGYVAALKDISGGSRQMQGILDLTGSHMKDFQGNVGGITDAVKKGGNSITGWSEVQGDFNQKMAVLDQTVQTLMIRLGQKLLPVATQLAGMFASDLPGAVNAVVGAFTTAVHIGQGFVSFLHDTGPAATVVKGILIILGGAMLGFAASAVPAAITAITASVSAFWAQATAAGAAAIATIAAAAPFILVGAAIGAVIAIIILAVTHWRQITTVLGDFKDMLGTVAGAIGSFVGNALGQLGNLVQTAIGLFLDIEVKAPLAFAGMVLGVLGHLKDLVGNALGGIGSLKDRAIQGFVDLASGVEQAVAGLPGKLLALGHQLIQKLAQGVRNAAGDVTSALKSVPLIGGVVGDLSHIIPHFADGGTMTQAGLALVGERGPELVRLPSGAQVIPNPSSMVTGLPSGTGTPASTSPSAASTQPIVLQVDGRTLARVLAPYLPGIISTATGVRTV